MLTIYHHIKLHRLVSVIFCNHRHCRSGGLSEQDAAAADYSRHYNRVSFFTILLNNNQPASFGNILALRCTAGQRYEARLNKTLLPLITVEHINSRAAGLTHRHSAVVKSVEHK
jgi:hypothetical protein